MRKCGHCQEDIPESRPRSGYCTASCQQKAHHHRMKEDPDYQRRRRAVWMSRFGLTIEAYDLLFKSQGGKCAICRKPPGRLRLAVDHDHSTNSVRGLLCSNCNRGIGHLQDDPEIVTAAAVYIRRAQLREEP